ncbi:hypothetical protein ENSA5_65600 [Enhygromyxa salina]|uniref:Uncharacterized protein n=1 Tax=Enhygromyxa salina TaxID=215803 RepID=A0A2S9XBT0_9BACT|nr:hypothetical protein [Enhygromyxa salina]PRP90313.1 hypothetical protein ENSA5_65600 [Enhygromyxa salina]
MPNLIPGSPVRLEEDSEARRSLPEVPFAVQDAFGAKAQVVLHRGRWSALAKRGGRHAFALFDGEGAKLSAVRTTVLFGQTLEVDAAARSLVIGGSGQLLYAVEPDARARCLGELPAPGRIESACWLPDGGVAFVLGSEIHVHRAAATGELEPALCFRPEMDEIYGLRCLPHPREREICVIAAAAERDAGLWAVSAAGQVHALARWDDLDLAEVRLCLDETGLRLMLPETATLAVGGGLSRVLGLAQSLRVLDSLPSVPSEPAPALVEGQTLAAPGAAEAKLEVTVAVAPDAKVAPALDRLGPLTAALIRMLRAGAERTTPDPEVLKLIRANMPVDLRAYVHAWAMYAPTNPTVYEFWAASPQPVTHGFIRELVGDSLQLGIFASGEPIVARRSGSSRCEVMMIEEEGIPCRYRGLEGFLADLQMRASELDDWTFELDAWQR